MYFNYRLDDMDKFLLRKPKDREASTAVSHGIERLQGFEGHSPTKSQ